MSGFTYREIALNKSILKEIKDERITSKKAGVYIVSLFTEKYLDEKIN